MNLDRFWDEETAPHGPKAHVLGQGIIYDGVRTLRTLWNDAGPVLASEQFATY